MAVEHKRPTDGMSFAIRGGADDTKFSPTNSWVQKTTLATDFIIILHFRLQSGKRTRRRLHKKCSKKFYPFFGKKNVIKNFCLSGNYSFAHLLLLLLLICMERRRSSPRFERNCFDDGWNNLPSRVHGNTDCMPTTPPDAPSGSVHHMPM